MEKQKYATFPEFVLVVKERDGKTLDKAKNIIWTMDANFSSIQQIARAEASKLDNGYVHIWQKSSDTDNLGRLAYTEAFSCDSGGKEHIGCLDDFVGFLWQCGSACCGTFMSHDLNEFDPIELHDAVEFRKSKAVSRCKVTRDEAFQIFAQKWDSNTWLFSDWLDYTNECVDIVKSFQFDNIVFDVIEDPTIIDCPYDEGFVPTVIEVSLKVSLKDCKYDYYEEDPYVPDDEDGLIEPEEEDPIELEEEYDYFEFEEDDPIISIGDLFDNYKPGDQTHFKVTREQAVDLWVQEFSAASWDMSAWMLKALDSIQEGSWRFAQFTFEVIE